METPAPGLEPSDDADLVASYRPEPWEGTSEAVVRAAEAAGVIPEETETVLGDVVNGDALDRLFVPPDPDGAATFELWGLVFVASPGEVMVYDP